MNCNCISLSVVLLISGLFAVGKSVENADRENETVLVENSRSGRALSNTIFPGIISCALRYDAACFVDVAQNYLDLKKRELLAQADKQVARAAGEDPDPDNKPSQIASTIEKLFSDLAGLFREGFSGFFGKDDDDEELSKEKDADTEEDNDDDDEDKKNDSSRDVGESRIKKKKKGPIKKLFAAIKIGILAVVVVAKVSLFVKIFEAAMKLKLVLLGLGALIVQVVRLWLDYKNNSHHEHVDTGIVYKNSFDTSPEWAGPGMPVEDSYGRSDKTGQQYAQNLAYSQYVQ